jgi:hypothetical protein
VFFPSATAPGRKVQPAGVRQQVVKQHLVDGLAFDLFKVFGSRFIDQIGRGHGRKTIGGAGATAQAIIERFLELFVPIQAPFNNGSQKSQTAPGNTGFMSGGAEDGTGNLAEAAFVTLSDLVVVFCNIHVLAYLHIKIVPLVGLQKIK